MKRRSVAPVFLATDRTRRLRLPDRRAYEYMPDMARDPAYKAFAPNPVTRDGLTLQHPVAGTIPRGYHPFHYGPGEQEAERAGRELKRPLSADSQDPGRRQGSL
jgi:predicted aminopeptidase